MTRQEFLEESQQWDWDDLINFCNEMGCSLCEDVYDEDARDECIDSRLEDLVYNEGWREIKNYLDDIPDGSDYYERDDWDDWCCLDGDDLEDRISDVVDWMDRNGLWDDEYDEEEEEECCDGTPFTEDEEDETPIEDEDIPISELLIACNKGLKSIDEERTKEEEVLNESFVEFVAEVKVRATVERG